MLRRVVFLSGRRMISLKVISAKASFTAKNEPGKTRVLMAESSSQSVLPMNRSQWKKSPNTNRLAIKGRRNPSTSFVAAAPCLSRWLSKNMVVSEA